ncbi:MAG: zinc-binding dehydrogenase [bacterium]|nr:zinc-binding dehydrogenase [bacterium]
MEAKSLIAHEGPRFAFEDVLLPDPGPDQIAVRTTYTGVSIGTEFSAITKKLDYGPYPLCTGYQAVGVVDYVGKNVTDFKINDRVYYRSNPDIKLASNGWKVSARSGTHTSAAVLDTKGNRAFIAPLPEGVNEEAASMFVMPAVGLNGVDMANPRMGDVVAVYGCGLVGLGVLAACSHRGCEVIAIDLEDDRLDIAKKLGADHLVNTTRQDALEEVHKIASEGADVVFESTGIPNCIDPAIQLCRTHGIFVLQGNYGRHPISYNFLAPHGKRLTMFYPCNDGLEPCRKAVLKNMTMGVLPWHHVITHRVASHDAPDLYTGILKGEAKNVIGAVIQWG